MRRAPDEALVSLKSTLTERDAIDVFTRHDFGWTRRVRRRQLRSIARVFVPYYAFHVTMTDGRRQQTGLFAVDAVHGTLDPFEFGGSVASLALERIRGGNSLAAALNVEAAWPILVDKLRRVVFQTGLWRIRTPRFSVEREPLIVHVPYWVGFYASGSFVRLEVLDDVRRSFEGAKARALFETWLADPVGGARFGRAAANGLPAGRSADGSDHSLEYSPRVSVVSAECRRQITSAFDDTAETISLQRRPESSPHQ